MNDLVELKNEEVVTTSLQIAKAFDKQHKHVIDAIEEKMSTAENSALLKMFGRGTYTASNGKRNKMYYMNKDGFTFIAMGFTGKKADVFKLKYIEAFNKMETALKEKNPLLEMNETKLNKLIENKVSAILKKQTVNSKPEVSPKWVELRKDIDTYCREIANDRRKKFKTGIRSYSSIKNAIYVPIKFALNLSRIDEMSDTQASAARLIFNNIKNNEYQNTIEK